MAGALALALAVALAGCGGASDHDAVEAPEPDAPQVVATPIGRLPLLPRPGPGDCADLAEFPFDEVGGLPVADLDDGDASITVHGFQPETRSIDLLLGGTLFVIRDADLVAELAPGPFADDAPTRRLWDTFAALYFERPDEDPDDPQPTLGVAGGRGRGGIRAAETPTVSNCSYDEGTSMSETADEPPG